MRWVVGARFGGHHGECFLDRTGMEESLCGALVDLLRLGEQHHGCPQAIEMAAIQRRGCCFAGLMCTEKQGILV